MAYLNPEKAKTVINLAEYAAGLGYVRDKEKSTRSAWSMKHPLSGTRIVVSRRKNGHWIWFDPNDQGRSGTIIDFVMAEKGLSFKDACSELAAGDYQLRAIQDAPAPKAKSSIDVSVIQKRLNQFSPVLESAYLESRGIDSETYRSPIFEGRILQGFKAVVLFPHFRKGGEACGYEIKGPNGFTSFPGDGEKGLWVSRIPKGANTLLIAESGIEALSYYKVNRPSNTILVSCGGNWNVNTSELLVELASLNGITKVIGAFNHDAGGKNLLSRLKEKLSSVRIPVTPHFPPMDGGDWNDYVKQFDMSN